MLVVSKKKKKKKRIGLKQVAHFLKSRHFFVSKHVDAFNNIRKYRTGKPAFFIYT